MALVDDAQISSAPSFRLRLRDHCYVCFQILTGILVAVDFRILALRAAAGAARRMFRRRLRRLVG
jgi:hypothetical protein